VRTIINCELGWKGRAETERWKRIYCHADGLTRVASSTNTLGRPLHMVSKRFLRCSLYRICKLHQLLQT